MYSPDFEVVAIGASLGGIKAVSTLLALLPADFGASIVLSQHLSPHYPSELASILNRRSSLPVRWAEQSERLQPARVYVAPPDRHLLVNPDGSLTLSQGERVQFSRPSVTALFESVAYSYGERAIGVILTGSGQDGAAGVQRLKARGGRALAQSAESCQAFGMPGAAIRTGCVDFVLPLEGLANALTTLVMVRGAAAHFKVSPRILERNREASWKVGATFSHSYPA